MFKKIFSLFRKKQPWEKQLDESMKVFNSRPIYKVLTVDIIKNTDDDELEQLVFDNICEIIGEMQGTEFEDVSKLSFAQQALYSTWVVEAEVNNGGFNQFYFNPSSEFAYMAVGGFKLFGLIKHAELLEKSNKLFIQKKPDLEKYNDGTLDSFSESYNEKLFDSFDEEFYKLEEENNISDARIGYIKLHPEEFI